MKVALLVGIAICLLVTTVWAEDEKKERLNIGVKVRDQVELRLCMHVA